ncbi:hypothetical protein GCM10010123_44540 [Pilimelia anulata]|uniref:Uncharacterized protein n=1 Tax=Pilimelia anulata TaxID=53371 RepID=A0A8J3FCR6_9ACTN|nr:hypothetical protein GCM10010123_44540 [Pilimelia anulata]
MAGFSGSGDGVAGGEVAAVAGGALSRQPLSADNAAKTASISPPAAGAREILLRGGVAEGTAPFHRVPYRDPR